MLAAGSVVLGGWELAGWDAQRLADDAALRGLVAGAVREAARVVRADAQGPLAFMLSLAPAPAIGLALRALPQVTRGQLAAMSSHHGPKIGRSDPDGPRRGDRARGGRRRRDERPARAAAATGRRPEARPRRVSGANHGRRRCQTR